MNNKCNNSDKGIYNLVCFNKYIEPEFFLKGDCYSIYGIITKLGTRNGVIP